MKNRVLKFFAVYFSFVVLFMLQKPLFMAFYAGMFTDVKAEEWLLVVRHGLSLDLSVAGYLMIVPAILIIAEVWTYHWIVDHIWRIYNILAALIIAVTFCLNLALYKYWGFPLDSTPLFYFLSSPSDAVASVSWTVVAGGIVAMLTLTVGVWCVLEWVRRQFEDCCGRRILSTGVLILLTLALFLPIRGGVTVSTQNSGKAYFSDNMKLNHAAVNPAFSLMESLSHEENFGEQYRFMDNKMATAIFRNMVYTGDDSTEMVLTCRRPDVYIVILESFSDTVMAAGATPNLKKLETEGLNFINMHANSFRTDRGTLAVLSGYPAQPTMSLMKYPKKTGRLPSIGRKMENAGYDLAYYYGGDADFTNMRSYLTGMGFTDIISDVSFPVKERLSKWGVPDHLVFRKLQTDLKREHGEKPLFRVLQTSSSHEPFDVPYHKLKDKVLNAFSYADDCIGKFIAYLKQTGRWSKSLVIFIPDHLGCYPRDIDNMALWRYQIPMVWTGGAIKKPRNVEAYCSQQDIAATLLGQLGIRHSDMQFSKNVFSAKSPKFAFFTVPDSWGMATDGGYLIYDNKSGQTVGKDKKLMNEGKAYLQKIYDDIEKR